MNMRRLLLMVPSYPRGTAGPHRGHGWSGARCRYWDDRWWALKAEQGTVLKILVFAGPRLWQSFGGHLFGRRQDHAGKGRRQSRLLRLHSA
jgi:hypothetical protein